MLPKMILLMLASNISKWMFLMNPRHVTTPMMEQWQCVSVGQCAHHMCAHHCAHFEMHNVFKSPSPLLQSLQKTMSFQQQKCDDILLAIHPPTPFLLFQLEATVQFTVFGWNWAWFHGSLSLIIFCCGGIADGSSFLFQDLDPHWFLWSHWRNLQFWQNWQLELLFGCLLDF